MARSSTVHDPDLLTLRRLRPEDVEAAAVLSRRCFPEGGAWSAAEFEEELARNFAEVWVVEEAGVLAGYAVAWFVADDAEILTIGTDPERRRRGVGRRLVERLKVSARERGARSLMLEVRASNTAGQALYRSQGFAPIDVRRRYYADGEDACVMAWNPARGTSPRPT